MCIKKNIEGVGFEIGNHSHNRLVQFYLIIDIGQGQSSLEGQEMAAGNIQLHHKVIHLRSIDNCSSVT